MNIIVGASGQVGSNVLKVLNQHHHPVRAVVRDSGKVKNLGVETRVADVLNVEQLTKAFEGGSTVFLLTPEDPAAEDVIGQTKRIVSNYREAIQTTGISKVVGLSCVGAHIEKNTGNILMSGILENGFDGLNIKQVFIRPSYYYSNWLSFIDAIKRFGVMPTFLPKDLQIDMNSPLDVARTLGEAMINSHGEGKEIIELVGPERYSPIQVAAIFEKLMKKKIITQVIPKSDWKEMLSSAGFSKDAAKNLSDMTQTLVDNIAILENAQQAVKQPTTLEQYLAKVLRNDG